MSARVAPARAVALGLSAHPEGGWFRSTWASPVTVDVPGVGSRPAATGILFLLEDGDFSAWHVVRFDEVWLWHGPDPLVLDFGGTGALPEADASWTLDGDHPQLVVPAGVWQRTRPVAGSALVSCVVSPGFTYDDWRLAPGIDRRD